MVSGRFYWIILGSLLVFVCRTQVTGENLFIYDVCLNTYNAGASSYIAEGCVYDLSHPLYAFCPAQIVIADPQPLYCGLKNNIWQSYTYRCQAYLDGADGFYNGACSCTKVSCSLGYECIDGNCVPQNTCERVNCPQGFECVEGRCQLIVEQPQEQEPQCTIDAECAADERCSENKCEVITCDNTACGLYQDCQFGVCFRKFDYFCSRVQPQVMRHYCPIVRPNQSECPTTTFLPPFSPTFCGVSYNNERHDFATGCEACKRAFVHYYYAQGCDTLPEHPAGCEPGSQCKNGQCVEIDFCRDITCSKGNYCRNGLCLPIIGFCHNDGDCDEGYMCKEDNLCELYVQKRPCDGVSCPVGQRCIDGGCFDNCYGVYCPAGTSCNGTDGFCHADHPACTDNEQCREGQMCLLGKCRVVIEPQPPAPDSCINVLCQSGSKCVGGVCVVVDLCQGVSCASGEVCMSGMCMDACMTVTCSGDLVCRGGECVDACADVQCSAGQKCQGGACVIDPFTCEGVRCSAGFHCEQGSCVANNFCYTNSHSECGADAICVNTRCMSNKSCVSVANCYGAYCVDGVCRSQLPQ